jgi:hypothetical protein
MIADRLAPEVSAVGRRLAQAQRESTDLEAYRGVEGETRRLIRSAEAALDVGDWPEAERLATEALTLDPERAAARDVKQAAQGVIERKRLARLAARKRAQIASAPPPKAPPSPVPVLEEPAPRPRPTHSQLSIRFASGMPRGVVTVYADGEQILQESFRFLERAGLLRRRPVDGELRAVRRLPAEPVDLQIYVAPSGRKAVYKKLTADLSHGGPRQLEIRLAADGTLATALR